MDRDVNKILSDNIGFFVTGNCTLSEAAKKACNDLEDVVKMKISSDKDTRSSISLIKILDNCDDKNRMLERLQALATALGQSVDEVAEKIILCCGDILEPKLEFWEELQDHWEKDLTPYEESVSDLKRRIKYSKNPMELKMLNKQLNELYKSKKRRKT